MQELSQASSSWLGAILDSYDDDGDAWYRGASFIVPLLGARETIAGAATAMDRQSAIDSHS